MTGTSGAAPEGSPVRVVVTVGTDHHRFDRLVHWVNDWLGAHPRQTPGFFMQSGSTTVVPVCAASPSVDVGQLDQLLDRADVIVCHGGPATIAAAWARDLLPIVVPRRPELGEHVDDHQVTFSRKVADLGRIRLAETHADFAALMATVTSDPSSLRGAVPAGDVDATVARFAALIDQLVGQPRRRPKTQRPVTGGLVPRPAETPENTASVPAASDRSREKLRRQKTTSGEHVGDGGQPRDSGGTTRSADGSPANRYTPISTADEEQG